MNVSWSILTGRYGADTRDPTPADLAAAIAALYIEDPALLTPADAEEHGAASLRYGFDDGPMYVLTITRSGLATLEEWADQDFAIALGEPRTIRSVTRDQALALWLALAAGDIAAIRDRLWA